MPIEPLTRIVEESYENGSQLSRLPNNEEMMNKINEIVEFVNYLENEKQSKPIKSLGLR